MDDKTPPSIQSVTAPGKATEVKMVFSEPVDKAAAETAGNYSVSGGVAVSAASLGTDLRTVTLTVSGIKDKADPANTMGTVNKTFSYIGQAQELKIEAEDIRNNRGKLIQNLLS